MKRPNLRAMTVDDLIALRANIERTLSTKVAAEREALRSKLAKLEGFSDGRRGRGARRGVKVPPKYRGPGGETWAGRGARPRWLTALLKQGRKIEEFAIAKPASARKAVRRRRKGRVRRKK